MRFNYLDKLEDYNRFTKDRSGVDSSKKGAGSYSRQRTKQYIGLGQSSAQETKYGMQSAAQGVRQMFKQSDIKQARASAEDTELQMAAWIDSIESEKEQSRDTSPIPKSYPEVVARLKNPEKAETLKNDPAFMSRLSQMKEEFPGLSEREVFKIIEGESNYNPTAKSKAGAVGLFQMMEEPLAELGFTPEEVMNMEPAEQLAVYSGYLKRWGYDGSFGLGIVQAAPAYRNASPDTVIYKKGSKEWKQNPGWRSAGGGDITKRSIENYYGRVE